MKDNFLELGIAGLVLMLAACPLVVFWLAPWSPSWSSSASSASNPTLTAEPTMGGPDTLVTLKGFGFPANTRVTVHLGPPNVGATANSYGEAMTDVAGNLSLRFKMPATWPDGTAITEPKVIIVALAGQGEVKAVAEFSYRTQA